MFGLDPRDEVAVKSRLAYVPDAVAFYPWMTVRERWNTGLLPAPWNSDIEADLLNRFRLDPAKDQPPVQRAEDPTGAGHRDLPRARIARAR